MSSPVLTGSARTVENLRRSMRNVQVVDRFMETATGEQLRHMMAKSEFRRAFEMWQEAAR